jgi:HEAT repeat protein
MDRKNTLEKILKKKQIFREDDACDLYEALGDVERHIRKAAAKALDQKGESCWLKLIKGDDDDMIRLGDSDLPKAVPALIYAMGWREIMFRSLAISKLGHIAVSGVVDQLAQALYHVNCRIRKGAAEALGYRFEPQAAKELIKVLDHFDPDVITNAADSLKAFDDPLIKLALKNLWKRCPVGVDMAVVKEAYQHIKRKHIKT